MSILFITGAGLSVASGIPTYHGEGGLYNGIEVERLLHISNVCRHPEVVDQIFDTVRFDANPNKAHHLIAELCRTRKHLVATQNVDGLHQKADITTKVLELHGNIHQQRRLPNTNYDVPNVVFFGEDPKHLPEVFAFAKKAKYVVTIGTESSFRYIRHMIASCKQRGGTHIDINPATTALNTTMEPTSKHTHLKTNAIHGMEVLETLLD